MNPFLIHNYHSPQYFCDRAEETKTLLENIRNQSNTTFFAQRRIGKTALIQHVFHHLKQKKVHTIYLDIYATQQLKDFTNQLANGIYNIFPLHKSMSRRFLEAIQLLRPVISMDEITGNPELTLDITQPRQFEKTIPQLLHFLDQQDVPTVIAIDEFQQILSYPEKNVEALLRSAIQQLKNTNFIFCGSDQNLMHQIFGSSRRPFYASTKAIHLQKIKGDLYAAFIRRQFEKHGFKIHPDTIELILSLTDCHTYYTQYLCHEMFASGIKDLQPAVVFQTLNTILSQNEGTYFQYRNLLTTPQWNLMRAIALETRVEKPYAQDFIYRHRLGTPANVKRSLEALLSKEMVYRNSGLKTPYYEVYDKFLMLWMQHK